MAAYFGTSLFTDAWLMASVFPNLLFNTINGALTTTVIPLMLQAQRDYSPASMRRFVREVFTVVVLASAILIAIGELFAPVLVHLVAPGFSGTKYTLTVVMTRWMFPTILFWGLAGLAVGVLQAGEYYFEASLSPAIVNVVRILTIIILGKLMGIIGVAIGFSLAVLSQLFLVIPPMRRLGIGFAFRWRFDHPLLRRMVAIALPFFLATSVGTVGIIVDRILASSLVTGSVAALNYSYVVVQMPIGLVISSLTTPLYTRLAQHHSEHDDVMFRELAIKGLRLVLIIIVPLTLWFILLSDPLLRILYQRGAFSTESTLLTAGTLRYFAMGLPGFALQFYLQRLFFATQDTRTTARSSVITIVINIGLDLLLVHPLQARGLALATGISAWVNSFILIQRATRGGRQRMSRNVLGPTAGGLALATVVMAGWTLLLVTRIFPLSHIHSYFPLVASTAAIGVLSLVPYLGTLFLFRTPELFELTARIAERLRRA